MKVVRFEYNFYVTKSIQIRDEYHESSSGQNLNKHQICFNYVYFDAVD